MVEKSAAFEVLLRRLHAVVLADTQKHWGIACLLEEVPNEKTLGMHEVIVKDLVKASQLIDQANKKTGDPGNDDD